MAKIIVSAQELKAKKDRLEDLNEQFKKHVAGLDRKTDDVLKSWDGDASNAFEKKYRKDRVVYDQFYKLINDYVNTLEKIITNYEVTEVINTITVKF